MKFRFLSEGFEKHTCVSTKKGDWFIFKCPECGYVRKWNPTTQITKVVKKGNENALHRGNHEPEGMQLDKLNPN